MEYEKGFCFIHFGKRFRELNSEEKREFFKLQKRINREEKGVDYDKNYYLNHKERNLELSKKWRQNNKEKVKEYQSKYSIIRKEKTYKERGYGPHEGNWTFRTFGKRYKDMTEEEIAMRNKIYNITKRNKENYERN